MCMCMYVHVHVHVHVHVATYFSSVLLSMSLAGRPRSVGTLLVLVTRNLREQFGFFA